MSDQNVGHHSVAIEKAFLDALMCMEGYDEGDMIMSWVLVGHVDNADENKGGGYPLLVSNGRMPNHIVRGLLHTALLKLDHGAFGPEEK